MTYSRTSDLRLCTSTTTGMDLEEEGMNTLYGLNPHTKPETKNTNRNTHWKTTLYKPSMRPNTSWIQDFNYQMTFVVRKYEPLWRSQAQCSHDGDVTSDFCCSKGLVLIQHAILCCYHRTHRYLQGCTRPTLFCVGQEARLRNHFTTSRGVVLHSQK